MGQRILNDPEADAKLRQAIAGKDHEVEIDLICRIVRDFGNVDTERLVLEYGRPFTGIPRPEGYRQWARKQCFRIALSVHRRDLELLATHWDDQFSGAGC
jgi:hypothetical protein